MGLITCKNCGKKISDTVENCIHCGKPIKETEQETATYDTSDKASSQQFAPFSFYTEDDRLALEREFLSNDEWAKKYRRTVEELPSFSRMSVFSLFLPILILDALHKFNDNFTGFDFLNSTIIGSISILSFILLAIMFVGMVSYVIFTKIHLKITMSKYIYMKKFQKWLKEVKQIDYTPTFIKIKEKEKFDQIDLDAFVS